MTRSLSRSVLCTAALLCTSALVVQADEARVAPLLVAQPTISLTAISSASQQTDVAAFLKAPVTFTVKDASFLSALDAVMNASGKPCSIECRQVKPMKLSFGTRKNTAGNVVDALARAGGCTLYVLPDKLLVSPASLLKDSERTQAKPFTILVSAATLPAGKTLPKQANGRDILALANTKISTSIQSNSLAGAAIGVSCAVMDAMCAGRPPLDRLSKGGYIPTSMSLSFDQVPLGEALSVVAELGGCQLYLLPDRFLICGPGELLTAQEQQHAVSALQPGLPPTPSAPAS